ncbi:MAG: Hsp20/alpha crystallin family protein [Desulfurivibrio sp.]|nr:Hsp20/alpha crystallin family protein [Desulfobacteraceae bacterium]MDZ7641831.1 Hsp20/alpha crystallin family protein [Desulfurivibrio sp.]
MDKKTEIAKREDQNIEKTRELYEIAPAVDIYENEDEILLYADMPGVVKDEISVNIDNGRLALSGVRKLETNGVTTWEEFANVEFVRNFSVPQTIDVGKVKAELKNGVLALHLPKSEEAKPRQVEIKTA